LAMVSTSAGWVRLPGYDFTGMIGNADVIMIPPLGVVGDVAVSESPDVTRVKPVNDSVCAEGFVNPPRANTAAVESASEQVPLSVIVTVCPEPDGAMPPQAPLNPATFLKDGDAGTVTPEEKTTVIVERFVNAPPVDGVKPMSHESATAAAVVVGTNVTLVSEPAPRVKVTGSDGLTAAVSTEVTRVKLLGGNVCAEGFVKPPKVNTIGVDCNVCEQLALSVIITVCVTFDPTPAILGQPPLKPETGVTITVPTGTVTFEEKVTVIVDAVVNNVPFDDDVKPMVQEVVPLPATGDDGENVTEEVLDAVMVTPASGLAVLVSDDVATVKVPATKVCAVGLVSPPILSCATVDPKSVQVPLSVIVTVSPAPAPEILVQLPAKPDTTEIEGDKGTLKGKTTVMVDVPVRTPFDEEVKPTVHEATTPATASAPPDGVTLTPVGTWVPWKVTPGAGLALFVSTDEARVKPVAGND